VKILIIVIMLLGSFSSFPLAADRAEVGAIANRISRDYEDTVREFTSSMDLSKQEKIKNFIDSGFAVALKKERERLHSLLPKDLHTLVDGDVYYKLDPGIGDHYIFFIKSPTRWVTSLKASVLFDQWGIISENNEYSLESPLVLINLLNGVSITVTFWEKSPATCQVTELNL
jgi:hypothetical protein